MPPNEASKIRSHTPPAARRGTPGSSRRIDPFLAAILGLALALRLWGVTNHLPDPTLADIPADDTAVDEGDRRAMEHTWTMWYGGTKPLDLNPHTGDWPGLPFYITLGAQVAYRANDLMRHPGTDAATFRDRTERNPSGIFLAGRLVGVAIGVASVAIIYILGNMTVGVGIARFAAALLAVLPFHVFSSQRVSDPNLLCLAFMLAASIFMIRGMRSERLIDSLLAGAFVGLGAASKYVPIVLLLPLTLAHVRGERRSQSPVILRWRALVAGLLASATAFLLASPFTILDRTLLRDMRAQQERLTADWVGISSKSGSLIEYLVRTLPDMMTWPGYILALIGCVLLWRSGREGRILVLVSAVFLAAVGILGMAQPRFVFPAVGPLILATAVAVSWIGERAARWSRGSFGTGTISVSSVALAAFLLWGLGTAVTTQKEMAKPDSRHVAHAAVERLVRADEMLALDTYGPVLRSGAAGRRAVVWPFAAARVVSIEGAFHHEWLDGVQYYMTSSEVTSRYEGTDPRDAREREFYEWIRANGRNVWSSASPEVFGPRIDLYRLPDAISTVAERDSLWAIEITAGTNAPRLERWTAEMSEELVLANDPTRGEEWTARGLRLRGLLPQYHQKLLEMRALALLQLGRAAESVEVAGAGRARFPDSSLLPVFHGMALEALGRNREAADVYRDAIRLSPEAARGALVAKIQELEAGTR